MEKKQIIIVQEAYGFLRVIILKKLFFMVKHICGWKQ